MAVSRQDPVLQDAAIDLALVHALQSGLPLVSRPYAEIAERLSISEAEVIDRVASLLETGVIKRLGVVVRHRELGYRANAMVVWDLPDAQVDRVGRCLGAFDCVTLCYRRPRRPPHWPFNLFTMIHGQTPEQTRENLAGIIARCGLETVPHEVLFSRRRFKQRGARYGGRPSGPAGAPVLAKTPETRP